MTSAAMSSQSTVVKKRKSWISDDDISSYVITISSELQFNQSMVLEVGDSKRCRLDKLKRRRYEVPLGFSRCSLRCRKLQCFAFTVDKNPDAVVEVSTSCEAVDEFYYEDLRKLDVNC
ncbi:hypothetical protein F511_09838 [Dorcoceras hygrometricum]|uniref:Uncharacterized protein n=1 Tax=Dorcoceras hygrometricum TaxID=472368 RepID=A0A2Z7C941_9LAMI|nr:hypothetical protein F511_09838 [Dorcoceras hygrometricum]